MENKTFVSIGFNNAELKKIDFIKKRTGASTRAGVIRILIIEDYNWRWTEVKRLNKERKENE